MISTFTPIFFIEISFVLPPPPSAFVHGSALINDKDSRPGFSAGVKATEIALEKVRCTRGWKGGFFERERKREKEREFVLLLLILVCCQPTELIWAFFVYIFQFYSSLEFQIFRFVISTFTPIFTEISFILPPPPPL